MKLKQRLVVGGKNVRTKSVPKGHKHYEQGIGYVRPENLTPAQFKKIMKKWEAKLYASGFQDIEDRNPNQTGTFTPFFRQNGSSYTFEHLYDSSVEEYYSLAREFSEAFVEKENSLNRAEREQHPEYDFSRLFRVRPALYRYLFYLHLHGVAYRQARLFLRGERPKYSHHFHDVKLPHPRVQQSRSVFWLHSHTQKALAPFYQWLQCEYGIDATNTYNREMKSELSKRKRKKGEARE